MAEATQGDAALKPIVVGNFRRILWPAALLAILGLHWVWLRESSVPPAWDMAYHQLKGWDFLEAFRRGVLWEEIARLSPAYPPLYYWIEAAVLGFTGDPDSLVFWSNLPGLLLLSLGAWRLAAAGLPPRMAVWAGTAPLLFPFSAWVARESLLDLQLAGLVSLAGYLAYRSDWFRNLGWTLLFGLSCAAGTMTKWTFPLYLAGPVLFGVWASGNRRRSLLNLVVAALASIPWTLPYYLPNLAEFASRYPTTEQAGLIPWKPYPRHGEPGLDNVWGWIYYPRVFISYYLCLPLAAAWLWGRLGGRRNGEEGGPPARRLAAYLWCWLLSGTALLTLLTPKDPRFALPLAAPLAVLLFWGWRKRPRAADAVFAVACLQFLLVSFSTPLGPFKLSLGSRPEDRDYQNLQREWVLLATHYFDVTGPPTRENWALRDLLGVLPEGARVGFLPDLVRFHPGALQLEARRNARRLEVFKIGDSADWAERLRTADFVVAKTGRQGISFITRYNEEVMTRLDQENWPTVGRWPLPDGGEAVLRRSPGS